MAAPPVKASGTSVALFYRSDKWRSCQTDAIQGGEPMLNWSITFLIIGLIAGVLGFTGVAGAATQIAWVLFVVFLVLFLISLVMGRGRVG
jgi:uncharacterized membrane protein YtjA (UPF0391 family)